MTKNNFKTPSAVLRLAEMPIVRSACALLTVCYSDTKGRHPSVRSACVLLENSVISVTSVAYDRFSPVINKMEPQIIVVNDLTCRGLDWLENTFPMLQKPTEQITADARSKILEVKDLVSIVGSGTMHLVQHTVTWAFGKMQLQLTAGDVADGGANLSLVTRALDAAGRGSDSALHMSVALMEQMLPPAVSASGDEKAGCVEGFEVGLGSTGRAELVASLTGKMLRSIQTTLHIVKEHFGVTLEFSGYHAQVKQQMKELVFKSPYLMEQVLTGLLTQAWSLRDLPQQIQHQLMSGIFFVSQMYTLISPLPQQDRPPLRPTPSPKTALYGKSVNRSPGNSPVLMQTFSNGKQRKRHVKITSPNGCSAAREIMFK